MISRPTTKMTPIGHHSSFNRKLHHLLMKTSNMACRGKWTLNHSSIIKTFSMSKKLKEHGYTPISFGTKATWTISHYIGTLNQRMVDEKTREKDYNAKLENDLPQLCGLVPVSFDFSTNREDDYLRRVCPYVTYAFFSGSDLSESECGELAKTAHGCGAKMVCMTQEAKEQSCLRVIESIISRLWKLI